MPKHSRSFGFVPGGPQLQAEMAYGDIDPRRGGRVLAAEEAFAGEEEMEDIPLFVDNYGFVPNDAVLGSELSYGFVPNDPVLGSELSYGADSDDDELDSILSDMQSDKMGFVPGGPQLEAEMRYGDADDAQMDKILSEMDGGGDSYGRVITGGADSAQLPDGLDSQVGPLSELVFEGFDRSATPDALEGAFGGNAARIKKTLSDIINVGEFEDIAHFLLSDPSFVDWFTADSSGNFALSDEDRNQIVASAVWNSAWPGADMTADDIFWQQWDAGEISPTELLRALVSDSWSGFYASLLENPALKPLLPAPSNDQQVFNKSAIGMWLAGHFLDVYPNVAAVITEKGQSIVDAARAAAVSASPPTSREPSAPTQTVTIVEEQLTAIIPEPIQQISTPDRGMLEPVNILMAGYGISILGALTGIF